VAYSSGMSGFPTAFENGARASESAVSETCDSGTVISAPRPSRGPCPKSRDYVLDQAVRKGELARISSYDGGALYYLGSYARANPDMVLGA